MTIGPEEISVQKFAGYKQKYPFFEGTGPDDGPLPAPKRHYRHLKTQSVGDVPKNGTPTAKNAKNAGGVPKNGTPTTLGGKRVADEGGF